MAFRNQPIAGQYLVRPALQSPNYVAGSAGWTVNRDGTAELNSVNLRGSLSIGSTGSQHAILANTATGDPIDVYNGAGQLVFSVNKFGVSESHNPSNGISAGLQTGQLEINDGAGNNDFTTILLPAATTAAQSAAELNMSPPVGTTYTLQLVGGSDDGSKSPTLLGNERGVQGSMVQSDKTSDGNLLHFGTYTISTDSGGTGVFNHGASFTPTRGILVGVNGIGANFFYQYAWFASPFTATTAKAAFKDNLGAALATTTLGAFGIFSK
jgi:hypothetical protein